MDRAKLAKEIVSSTSRGSCGHEYAKFRARTHARAGKTPLRYILQVRVEAAQRQLDRTDRGLKQIALDCGFGSADVMRGAFIRLIGVIPDQYRQTWSFSKADL
jgi:transcriptional regulator GlxA family with amidase domain